MLLISLLMQSVR